MRKTLDLQERLVNGCDRRITWSSMATGLRSRRGSRASASISSPEEFSMALYLFASRPAHQLAARVWTDVLHSVPAAHCLAKSCIDRSRSSRCRPRATAWWHFSHSCFHLQSHACSSIGCGCLPGVRAAELRHVACLLTCDRQQPGGKRFVPLHRQTGHISDDAFKFMQ